MKGPQTHNLSTKETFQRRTVFFLHPSLNFWKQKLKILKSISKRKSYHFLPLLLRSLTLGKMISCCVKVFVFLHATAPLFLRCCIPPAKNMFPIFWRRKKYKSETLIYICQVNTFSKYKCCLEISEFSWSLLISKLWDGWNCWISYFPPLCPLRPFGLLIKVLAKA